MKKTIAFFVLVFIISSIAGCQSGPVTKDNLTVDSVYSKSLGVGIRLGMGKSEVDKLLGEGELQYESYFYQPDGVIVDYTDGKVSSITCQYPNDDWITQGDIMVESTKDDVLKKFDQTKKIDIGKEDQLLFGYNSSGILTNTKTDVKYGIGFTFNIGNKVSAYTIFSNNQQ